MPILFGKHLLCLLSPTHHPADIKDASKIGNLFTLFLCDPLTAFCFIMGKSNVSKETYDLCLSFKDKMFDEIGNLLLEQGSIRSCFPFFLPFPPSSLFFITEEERRMTQSSFPSFSLLPIGILDKKTNHHIRG